MTAACGLLLLVPDTVTGLSGGVVMALYRVAVLGWLVLVAALMALTSARVVDPVRARLAGRRRRRHGIRPGFPTEWDALIEHDRDLARRLLAYDHDLELAVNAPVMHDYSDPHTAAAVEAMLRCDVVRTPAPPPGTRSVEASDYGQAVIAFEEALVAAEANASRLAASTFTDDERRALDEAAAMLDYLRAHATTPQERDDTYRQVKALLERSPRTRTHEGGARPHPFLTVAERAR